MDTGNSLVIAGGVRVVEVTVGVGSAQDAQTQPAEVLLAGSARHLVAAVHFLQSETGGVKEEVMKTSCYWFSMKLTGTPVAVHVMSSSVLDLFRKYSYYPYFIQKNL